ncbi:putative RNA methyltransferase [Nocardia asteroides NBRC 15531]|uniref:RNA methyltransferase n=1 Tax=Nocardia asteroides NBRC 15531 TaxID=1110697 RepID=U5E9X0_NOCAS|nr:putative RNA methyltransferase [Nocardia asteroides NBRC 15531]SFN33470.1 16S rRNA (cytosine967-C5)-methyltransferase [Nocardia asteroides]
MSASDRRRRREADQRSGAAPRDDRKVTGKNVDGGWAARAAKSGGTVRAGSDRDTADRRRTDEGRGTGDRRRTTDRGTDATGRNERPRGDDRARGRAPAGGSQRGDGRDWRGGGRAPAGEQRRGEDHASSRRGDDRGGDRRADAVGRRTGDDRGRGAGERSAVGDGRGRRDDGGNRASGGGRGVDERSGRGSQRDRVGRAGGGSAAGRGGSGRGVRDGDSAGRGGRDRGAGETARRSDRPDPSVPSPRKRRGEPVDAAREVALDVLRAVRERDAYANLVLPKLLRERKISGRDAAFATELTYGASRSQGQLDAVIAACAGRPVEEIDGPILDILRLGVYQLLRTRTGAHAAVDTSVDLARAEFGQGRAGFVNAVLRRAGEKTAEQWVAELAPADPIGGLAFEYAHPTWIAQSFADALGAQAGELAALLAADDERPVVHLVARPGEITAEELALVTGGEEGRWSPYAVYLDGGDPGQLEPVREGIAAVQDEGSQLVALALTRAPLAGPDQGRWLDLCAGPGGKAALLGALAAIDLFTVDAVEPAEHRAELVRTSTRGLPVTVHVADGRDTGLTPGYDRVLVDAPCTGLGALRRRPEARWRRTPADVPELVTLQRELLAAAWDLLRPGGVVVYSTCSPHLAETVGVVGDFVRRSGAEQLDTRDYLPGVTDLGDGPSAQLWPHRHGTDAMFLAALRKPLD